MSAGPTESEVKLRVAHAAAARELLRAAGAAPVRDRHFEDNLLFDDPRGALAAEGRVLRLRRTRALHAGGGPDQAVLTLKGPRTVSGGIKSREELETVVADGDVLQGMLERLGYVARFRYQKYREEWRLGELLAVVDETPVGCFLELEGSPASIPAGARALGYETADFVSESYAALFAAAGGSGDMVFA